MNKKLLPLTLLAAADDTAIEGITRFQKLVFLAQREELADEPYPFSAGKYGPFSKKLYDDIDRLVAKGFIRQSNRPAGPSSENDTQVYELTQKGRRALRNGLKETDELSLDDIASVVSEYNETGLWDLLEHVYGEYPEMAENSKLNI